MKEITKKFVEEANELKAICMKAMADESMLMSMDPESLTALQKTMKLLNTSLDYTLEHAEMMDQMNDKLDKLLAHMEKES